MEQYIPYIALGLSGLAIYLSLKKESVVTYKTDLDDVKRIDELEKDFTEVKNVVEDHQDILRNSKA